MQIFANAGLAPDSGCVRARQQYHRGCCGRAAAPGFARSGPWQAWFGRALPEAVNESCIYYLRKTGGAHMPAPEFPDFLAALRTGDPQALEEFLREIDPFLRQVIRLRLIDSRLRRVVDTTDILQSLLKDFLSRRQSDTPPGGATGGLYAYLIAAVRKKILARLRKECRHLGSLPDDWDAVSPEPSPAQQAERRDLYQVVRARLSEDKRLLFDLRAQGRTWPEIAQQVGGKPNALRVRLSKAIRTILNDLEGEESRDAR